MTDNEPLLPRGVLSDSPTQSAGRPRFAIDWDTVTTVAKGPLPFTDGDRADIEAAAGRYRQEVDREAAGDGIKFAAIRDHAKSIAKATEALQGLLADPMARTLNYVPTEELDRLHAEATRVATAKTSGQGSKAYSFDLRHDLVQVMADRWHRSGRTEDPVFYSAGAEVLRQLGVGGAIRSRETPFRNAFAAIRKRGAFDTALLQKGGLRHDFPFPLQVQATRTISAVPRALKRFMSATRM
jgi:hypothetical protein